MGSYILICSDLLNLRRSLDTMVITTESDWKSVKVIFTQQFLAKVAIFCCFDVCSVRPPQIFQVQAKISTVLPVFPDYLSVSYDYVANKGWPMVNYRQFSTFDRPYLSCNDHRDRWVFQSILSLFPRIFFERSWICFLGI